MHFYKYYSLGEVGRFLRNKIIKLCLFTIVSLSFVSYINSYIIFA